MESLWREQRKKIKKNGEESAIRQIPADARWDVIIVGAGMAGLLTAYYLKEQGKKVLVLEADRIASGQTERTTAKITSQHGLKYSRLIRTVGRKKARLYAQANEAAIGEYERLIQGKGIQCQFERVPAYLYTRENERLVQREAEAAASLGIEACFTRETELPFPVKGAAYFRNQAQFSPLEFIEQVSSELEILERAKVTGIRGNRVFVSAGQGEAAENRVIAADKIVVATHYPLLNVPGFYFLRQHQERSYVLALSGCDKIEGMYYGVDSEGLSFRQAGDFLLLGGGSGRTGENEEGGAYEGLLKAANRYFPKAREEARWSAQDCMPHDGIPFIGRYSALSPKLYVATGFQKWGMTSAMVAAMILKDELCGMKNPYSSVFQPLRMNVRAGMGSLLVDVGKSTKGLAKGLLHLPVKTEAALPRRHGGILRMNGKRYACYRDEKGGLHKISARCPHMGCELAWNPDEKSWDCPCHGSRFDVDGTLLDNPAKKPAEKQ